MIIPDELVYAAILFVGMINLPENYCERCINIMKRMDESPCNKCKKNEVIAP